MWRGRGKDTWRLIRSGVGRGASSPEGEQGTRHRREHPKRPHFQGVLRGSQGRGSEHRPNNLSSDRRWWRRSTLRVRRGQRFGGPLAADLPGVGTGSILQEVASAAGGGGAAVGGQARGQRELFAGALPHCCDMCCSINMYTITVCSV